MTTLLEPLPLTPSSSDALLLSAARLGNRQAFSHIVQRYQSLITGLTYASCGNLHRSEDLAQETFLAAWKSLDSLRDPAKLPAWLCQIARNRLIDLARKDSSEQSHINTLQQQTPALPEQPADPLLIAEERELLWRSLSQIPQPYRDTMVLFYRQSQSTAAVAAALEVSEEAVRQRLARGREMLREQVASLLERNLTTSAPTQAFTQAVLAALPITLAPAAVGATSLKTAAAAKSLGLLPLLLLLSGPIIAIAGTLIGTISGFRNAPSPAAKKHSILHALLMWSLIASIIIEQITLSTLDLSPQTYMLAQSITWTLFGIISSTAIFLINRNTITTSPLSHATNTQPKISNFVALSITLSATVGGLAWLFHPSLQSHDTLATTLIASLAFLLLPTLNLSLSYLLQKHFHPTHLAAGMFFNFTLISSITLTLSTLLHWRLYTWLNTLQNIDLPTAHSQYPLWPTDLATLTLTLYSGLLLLIAKNRRTA